MTVPYRDDFAFVREVEQHVGIVLVLLEQHEDLVRQMFLHAQGTSELAELRERARWTGHGIWDHLEQAHKLARDAGRVIAPRRVSTSGQPDRVRSVIAALAAAVPEAIFAAPPPVALPRSWLARWWWIIAFFAVLTLVGWCSP